MITFTLPAPLEFEINQIAEAEHTTASAWIAEKLARVIEDYSQRATQDENTYLAQLADDVMARGEQPLSQDDAMRMLNELVD